jgi:GNAT superfamily N-acetyltransferase
VSDPVDLDPDVGYWLEMAEVHATREYFAAAIEAMPGNPLGLATRDIGGGVAVTLGGEGGEPFFSRALGLGIERPATEADLDAVIAFYAEHDRTTVSIPIAPQAEPAELREWATARGFPESRRWPKLWRSLETVPEPPPTDLRIEAIGPDQADAFADIVLTAFEFDAALRPMLPPLVGRPGWHQYLGFDGDLPVAAGAMYLRDDIAWLGYGATLESHRGRGGQSAIFHRRIADARDHGCRLAITETGPDTPEEPNPSFHNMLRIGFQLGYHRPNFVRRPAAATADDA